MRILLIFFLCITPSTYPMLASALRILPQSCTRTLVQRASTDAALKQEFKRIYTAINNNTLNDPIDTDGNTLLHCAPTIFIPLLLEHGANPALKNNESMRIASYHIGADPAENDPSHPTKQRIYALLGLDVKDIKTNWCYSKKGCEFVVSYEGITPIMRSIGNMKRLQTFFTHAPREIIEQQMAALLVLAQAHKDPRFMQALKKF